MIKQGLLVRIYLNTESDAREVIGQLSNMNVMADHVKADHDEPGRWKVIFISKDAIKASIIIKSLILKPKYVDMWDPATPVDQGWNSLFSAI